MTSMSMLFDINCKRCPRLVSHLVETRQNYPDYYCKPVPAYGDRCAKLLIVGLAPGLHGANATGIPFTGDASGELLFSALTDGMVSAGVNHAEVILAGIAGFVIVSRVAGWTGGASGRRRHSEKCCPRVFWGVLAMLATFAVGDLFGTAF